MASTLLQYKTASPLLFPSRDALPYTYVLHSTAASIGGHVGEGMVVSVGDATLQRAGEDTATWQAQR